MMIAKAIIVKAVHMNGLGITIDHVMNCLQNLMSLLNPNTSQLTGREQATRFKERDDLKDKIMEIVNTPNLIQNGNGSLFKTLEMYLTSVKEKWCDQRTYAVTSRGGPFFRSNFLFMIKEESCNLYPHHLTAGQVLLCMRSDAASLAEAAHGWPAGHENMLGLWCVYYFV
jgi:hypothetical protein